MTMYTTEELLPTTKLVKNFWQYSEKLRTWELEKIWVLKNNELDLTIIPSSLYSFFEEMIENIEIYSQIINRQNKNDFVDAEDILWEFNLSLK